MVWNASGAERVKSYRVYQELEDKYTEAVSRIKELEKAIQFKDGLIRSLAAEVAMLPKSPTSQDLEQLFDTAADVHAKGSGLRRRVGPGAYSEVGTYPRVPDDGTAENDPAVQAAKPTDPLGHIPSPKKTKK